MNFDDIARAFEDGPSGTDQFKTFFKGAFQLMKTDSENAALYFPVGIAAQAYVLRYEDQAVESALADKAKATLVEFNKRLASALPLDPAQRLRVASSLAISYEWDVREF